jgi:hypothetical protein
MYPQNDVVAWPLLKYSTKNMLVFFLKTPPDAEGNWEYTE